MPVSDHDYIRTLPLFEWTFAVLVVNFTLQTYRLASRFATTIFSATGLAQGRSLFESLNDAELMPYSKYLSNNMELAFRLGESLILILVSIFAAKSFLAFAVVGLVVCSCLLLLHVITVLYSVLVLSGKCRR